MTSTSPQRHTTPKRDNQEEVKEHWCKHVFECVVCVGPSGSLNLQIAGGSDNGEFPYFINIVQENIKYLEGHIENNDIILEIQGQKVAGFTQKDVIAWLNHCCRNGSPLTIVGIRAGYLHKELRKYLQFRFQKNTPDHDLQNAIRDNLYLRTVPCTTRPPREGEINGTDYTFLTVDQFMALERSGKLLESGIYEGHHYGTPQPDMAATLPMDSSRHRNPSGVEALNLDPAHHCKNRAEDQWEKAYTENGEPYYINHTTGTSQWTDPWANDIPHHLKQENHDSEPLPEGWEKIDDPHYGTYYIDHINKKTQYENPLTQAVGSEPVHRDSVTSSTNERAGLPHPEWHHQNGDSKDLIQKGHGMHPPQHQKKVPYQNHLPYVFTPHPHELQGDMIRTVLIKGTRGFGFTIVGGDSGRRERDAPPEFLQIKSVVPGGPAWQDGKLATGDVLVYVGEVCVLGYTHGDVVRLFQAIPQGPPGTSIQVCRGYPLPFDLDDPNTQVVTTNAVDAEGGHYLGLDIKKGPNGFGFTIADSGNGQKVKKILDPAHCKLLQEGDVLVDINGQDVRALAHDDIVQLLKECSIGDTAYITVLRNNSPPRPRFNKVRSSEDVSMGGYQNRSSPLVNATYRSKTPTADMYSLKDHPHPWPPLLENCQYPTMPPPAQRPTALDATSVASDNVFYPTDYTEMIVTLHRQESGFGFRIVGGTEEGSQVAIGHIVPGGSADLEGTLRTGDEIVSIDNQCVINTSHHYAVQLMANAAQIGHVTLQIRRHFHSGDSGYTSKSNDSIYPYDVTVHREENEGFGFVIISSVNKAGSTIGRILEGSPAERCGQLHVGDRILAVNGQSILHLPHGDIVNLIKESGLSATLTIGPPQQQDDVSSNSSQKGIAGGPDGDNNANVQQHQPQYLIIQLQRGARGFGFSIRGGREFHNMPLFVLRIAEGGPAHEDGRLRVGDRILEINGVSTATMTHSQAIEAIRQGGATVRLLVCHDPHPPPTLTLPPNGGGIALPN